MLGDFEGHMDGWVPAGGVTTAFSTQGATHGTGSLQVTFPSGWINSLQKDMRSQAALLQTMTSISMDVTTRNDGGQIPGGLSLIFVINSETGGWQSFDLSYPGVPTSPRTDTLTVTIPQSVRDNFIQNGTGSWGEFFIITNSGGGILWLDDIRANIPEEPTRVTIDVDAGTAIRTIPMTLYGANLASWDGSMGGSNTTFNDLMKASGCKYFRIPGGSWANGHLWSDIEELNSPYGSSGWKVSYDEYLYLMSRLSQPGQEIPPTLQPIVNFPGGWYGYTDENGDYITILHGHEAAVEAAVAWVQDQTARDVCAEYWEIGNEIGGPWEVGWFEGISGAYYGDYFADFYLGMKAVNPDIKMGACAEPVHKLQEWGWYDGYWTYDTLRAAKLKNVVPDFLIIHSYQNGGGDGSASNNPNLLGSQIDEIAQWTSNLDSIVQSAIGAQYVGRIEYGMTEWNTSAYDPEGTANDYDRPRCYINAMFRAQYTLEMAKHNWTVSNPWIYDYDGNYWVFPAWYVKPLLIYYFGRDMVQASSSESPLVRAYAAKDAQNNLTLFIVNNSPTADLTADVNISGFAAGAGGQRWLVEPAGSIIANGLTIQDKVDISINGVVHPDPLSVNALPSQPFASGNTFTVTLPASGMMLLKIPAGTGDVTPPAAPTGLSAGLNGAAVVLDWEDNTETDLAGYNVYRSTPGGDYLKLNGVLIADSSYVDSGMTTGRTYYYVVKAVDTSWNESAASNEPSVAVPVMAMGSVLREWWTGISGASVSHLTSHADYPDNPTGRELLTSVEGPINWNEEYGTRIRGYLYPPTTGSYTFWIAGDDNCQLWLSTDGTPAHKTQIAYIGGSNWTDSREWDQFTSQRSSPLALTAGQKYYIEVLHKEDTGGDNIAVAWEGPGIARELIPGEYLSPWLIGVYGDYDDSGLVSIGDLAQLAAVWLQNDCTRTSRMDLDGDCVVDLYEFSQFSLDWMDL